MEKDKFGQIILTENDLCDLYYKNPSVVISNCLVDKPINFDDSLELEKIPNLITYAANSIELEEFDQINQQEWHMPEQYKNLDIAAWLLDKAKTDPEIQRVGEELLLYADRNLLPLLQYLKYLVDTMRQHNIIWGVGRGSSVSSYVLYLLGVHRINSLYYDLDIHEFLRKET